MTAPLRRSAASLFTTALDIEAGEEGIGRLRLVL
jgi:hypothetical protein